MRRGSLCDAFANAGEAGRRVPAGLDRRVAFQELGDRALERGQALVHLDHLIRADRIVGIDVGLVLGPLRAAFATVEEVAIRVGSVDVDFGVLPRAPTGTFTLVWFQL